jgi:hypothetical protein
MRTIPLNQVFVVKHGTKLDLNKMVECDGDEDAVAFIGRTSERNGFVAFVRKLSDVEPFDSGAITVALGGSALSSFVQPRQFYTAQNIDVLIPRVAMSLDVKLYYCLCIEANRFRYSTFGREANRTLKHLLVPDLESVSSWAQGAMVRAIEGLCSNLIQVADSSKYEEREEKELTMAKESPPESAPASVNAPGPKPDTLTLDTPNWRDAIKQSLQKTKPPEGWPKPTK